MFKSTRTEGKGSSVERKRTFRWSLLRLASPWKCPDLINPCCSPEQQTAMFLPLAPALLLSLPAGSQARRRCLCGSSLATFFWPYVMHANCWKPASLSASASTCSCGSWRAMVLTPTCVFMNFNWKQELPATHSFTKPLANVWPWSKWLAEEFRVVEPFEVRTQNKIISWEGSRGWR